VLSIGAVLGILILVNLVAYQNPWSQDLTEDQRYSLAPETQAAVDSLTSDVRLIGFYSPDRSDARDSLRPLLQQYQQQGDGRVSYEFVDPREQPYRAQDFGVTRDASVVVAVGDSSEVVALPSEQEITAALVRLANPGARKVYFLTGHGERDLDATDEFGYAQLRQALEAKNYAVEELNLLLEPQVPDDALAVVIAGATAPLSAAEVDALRAHVAHGGGLVALLDPTPGTTITTGNDALATYLEQEWGVAPDDDLVVDLGSTIPLAAIAASYATHPVTEKLQNLATYFPTARSIRIGDETNAEPGSATLVETGANSWGETSLAGLTQDSRIEFDETKDLPGPLAVAVSAEDADSGARLVVIGDSDFAANADFFGLGNGDLMVNSIDWAAGQDSLISLTPKGSIERFVSPPSRQVLVVVALVSIVLVPAVFLGIGLSTWWGRRARG
jgi:ABC-type uncharacterized transport system involved in gliding motility auxiliary subunit